MIFCLRVVYSFVLFECNLVCCYLFSWCLLSLFHSLLICLHLCLRIEMWSVDLWASGFHVCLPVGRSVGVHRHAARFTILKCILVVLSGYVSSTTGCCWWYFDSILVSGRTVLCLCIQFRIFSGYKIAYLISYIFL